MQPTPGFDPEPKPRRVTAGIHIQSGGGWRVILGMLIVGWGLLLTAANLHNDVAYRILEHWYFPSALTVLGVYRLFRACTGLGRAVGAGLAVLGGVWLASETLGFRFDPWDWWPLAMVGFGVVMIFRAINQRGDNTTNAPASDFTNPSGPSSAFGSSPADPAFSTAAPDGMPAGPSVLADGGSISAFAFWSGVKKRVSAAFKQASLAAVMGGIELDLRPAVTVGGKATLEVFAFMGGIEITVPPDWTVTNEALVIMGGIDDRSSGSANATQRLVIRGLILMGGVEIKT